MEPVNKKIRLDESLVDDDLVSFNGGLYSYFVWLTTIILGSRRIWKQWEWW